MLTNKIKEIARHYNLNPSAFADQVNVSRPVISHIFSERNKPSLEVVQKIGMAFPEISLEWLLFGQGNMLKTVAASSPEDGDLNNSHLTISEKRDLEPEMEKSTKPKVEQKPEDHLSPKKSDSRTIERIVIFYSDNTFNEFKPST